LQDLAGKIRASGSELPDQLIKAASLFNYDLLRKRARFVRLWIRLNGGWKAGHRDRRHKQRPCGPDKRHGQVLRPCFSVGVASREMENSIERHGQTAAREVCGNAAVRGNIRIRKR